MVVHLSVILLCIFIQQDANEKSVKVSTGFDRIAKFYSTPHSVTISRSNELTINGKKRGVKKTLHECRSKNDIYLCRSKEDDQIGKEGLIAWNKQYLFGLRRTQADEPWAITALSSDWNSELGQNRKQLHKSFVIQPDKVFHNLSPTYDFDLKDILQEKNITFLQKEAGITTLSFVFEKQTPTKQRTIVYTGTVQLEENNNYAPLRFEYATEGKEIVTCSLTYAAQPVHGHRPCIKCERTMRVGNISVEESIFEYRYKHDSTIEDKDFFVSAYGFKEPEAIGTPDAPKPSHTVWYILGCLVFFAAAILFRGFTPKKKTA